MRARRIPLAAALLAAAAGCTIPVLVPPVPGCDFDGGRDQCAESWRIADLIAPRAPR